MAILLNKLSKELNKVGYAKRSPKARAWLRNHMKNMNSSSIRKSLLASPKKQRIIIGRMFFFLYDAKHKDTLPYWDRFPLIIPISYDNESMLGINLHYLPINLRLVLLDKLYDYLTDDRFDEKTRLRVSYNMLSNVSRFKEVEPCLKKYLFSQLESNFIEVPADQWEEAVFLPVEQFQGSTKLKVHNDSKRIIKGRK